MIRITDQYFWNFVFTIFFLVLLTLGVIILDTEAYREMGELTILDLTIITLATWRMIRLFVYDAMTKFFREQFFDVVKTKDGMVLEKPARGPRRTIADLMGCPWCFGVWSGAMILFFYVLTPYAYYPIVLLALSAVATWLQIFTNLIGHGAERLKNQNQRDF